MENIKILKSLDSKSNGEIYLGVVGSVRTGKSTFIKKCIEELVLPHMDDGIDKKRCMDEIPQTASGKTIMTIEPKFVPSTGANIKIEEFKTNIRFVDCVGFVVNGSLGYEDELGNPRMVKTPWFSEELPFVEAAEIGTKKVIQDHSTIGIVITTDGSFTDLSRSEYKATEEKIITELEEINKPFIVIMNSSKPKSNEAIKIVNEIKEKHKIPVIAMNIEEMTEEDIMYALKEALYEFKIEEIKFNIPDWIGALKPNHKIKKEFLQKMKESVIDVYKLRDTEKINLSLENNSSITKAYISNLDSDTNEVTITLDAKEELYDEILKEIIGTTVKSKGDLIKIFQNFSEGKNEYDLIKDALKQVNQTGYGIVLPKLKDMKIENPEVIKQGNRYGMKLQAKASSIHLIKVDVESSFEPIIGSELQSKELIDSIMSDKNNPEKILNSEIFGRSLGDLVGESIQAKLSLLPETTKQKLSQTITKMVNKGSNNLIAIVL